ncbi:MAG TPA: hypothetical protein VHW09_27325 [Bryobacteraceae bacterium]|nr:hypothetical protein [Bryobacteraceae bacterium]
MTLIAILLTGCSMGKSGETTITVTGTLNGGNDPLAIFGGGVLPAGTPYTLVFTFDDTKGQDTDPGCSGSGIGGTHEESPGTATLTINGKSYDFGQSPDATSKAWRKTGDACSEIGMEIGEGRFPFFSTVSIRVSPPQGTATLTSDSDWRSRLSVDDVYARNTYNSFVIQKAGNYARTMSYLSVSSLKVR